jgi:hypothetical protein
MFSHTEQTTRRMVSDTPRSVAQNNQQPQRPYRPATNNPAPARPILAPASQFKPQPKPAYQNQQQQQRRPESSYVPPEPTYHNLMSAREVDAAEERR